MMSAVEEYYWPADGGAALLGRVPFSAHLASIAYHIVGTYLMHLNSSKCRVEGLLYINPAAYTRGIPLGAI